MLQKRELLISKGWIQGQGVLIVGLLGFLLLGILAYRTYTDDPAADLIMIPIIAKDGIDGWQGKA